MATGKISKRTVDATHKGARDQFLWDAGDESVKGFGLKVTPAGKKVYLFQYRMHGTATTKRYTIGQHGRLTPDEARTEAKRLGQLVEVGVDPIDDRANRERQATEKKASDQELAFDAYCRTSAVIALGGTLRSFSQGLLRTIRSFKAP
jgi:hypothetical protein